MKSVSPWLQPTRWLRLIGCPAHPFALSQWEDTENKSALLTYVAGRGLHSSTFRLNVSAFCGTGGAFRGCLGGAQEVNGGITGCLRVGCILCQKRLRLSWKVDECKPLVAGGAAIVWLSGTVVGAINGLPIVSSLSLPQSNQPVFLPFPTNLSIAHAIQLALANSIPSPWPGSRSYIVPRNPIDQRFPRSLSIPTPAT